MLQLRHWLTAAALTFIPTLAAAADVYADPAQTDADFPVQGEYAGTVKTTAGEEKYGLQVVARGAGKFYIVGYSGGLPGEGWTRDKPRAKAEATIQEGKLSFKLDKLDGVLQDGKVSFAVDGAPQGTLKRVERTSPTLGEKPPEGAVVLFDGSTADKFEGGRMTEDKLLMEGVTSKAKFQNFHAHLEFRLPYMPKATGQGRGNSGFYAQGRYETQMLDSFGLEGENNECGGIYTISKPAVNMCLPPLVWQTYDVDYVAAKFDPAGKKTANARMTVRHNGVVVQDDVELTHGTTAAPVKEGPEPGPIHLQNHGNPVRYRNIWIVETKPQ